MSPTQLDELRRTYDSGEYEGRRLCPKSIRNGEDSFCWTTDDSERKRCQYYLDAQYLSDPNGPASLFIAEIRPDGIGFSCGCCGVGPEFRCFYHYLSRNSGMIYHPKLQTFEDEENLNTLPTC